MARSDIMSLRELATTRRLPEEPRLQLTRWPAPHFAIPGIPGSCAVAEEPRSVVVRGQFGHRAERQVHADHANRLRVQAVVCSRNPREAVRRIPVSAQLWHGTVA